MIKAKIKIMIKKFPLVKKILWGRSLYRFYCNENEESLICFMLKHFFDLYVQPSNASKASQIEKLINKVSILPVNNVFFYSIDFYKTLELDNHILDNYSIDYTNVINNTIAELVGRYQCGDSAYSQEQIKIINALKNYYNRVVRESSKKNISKEQCDAIGSMFEREANSFFEGLQRILFYNQFLWQTKHKHNGFGRLDKILYSLYENDLKKGILNESDAKTLIQNFYIALHENCWYKSTMLLGDTGQIIVLGGVEEDGTYYCNDLTYLFIDVLKDLAVPDPKVLLRCSADMPSVLLRKACECISTGVGSPFLSNDDSVIPALIEFGYNKKDAYNYVTAACWEPLIAGISCDQNNIASINFATPFINMFDDSCVDEIKSVDELLDLYKHYLKDYLDTICDELSKLKFEIDPLVSLVSSACISKSLDITLGGAVYNNLGVTSVAIGTVVNSLINIEKYVFEDRLYSLKELNKIRKQNYSGEEELLDKLKKLKICYGCEDSKVIEYVDVIQKYTCEIFEKHHTFLGGDFKFGLSSPNYVVDAQKTDATFDGRKAGEPFSVHISSTNTVSPTELIRFASKLNYLGARSNGNVVDFCVVPELVKRNIGKFIDLIRVALDKGVYQMQINVVDSKTLIDAKRNPQAYKHLIVRVWGFSAYFVDLPEDYKDILINRAITSEKMGGLF